MELEIRHATQADADGLARVLIATGWFEWINGQDAQATSAHVRNLLTQIAGDHVHTLWVAVAKGGEVAGYASVHWLPYLFLRGPEGFLSELFVHPNWRGQGVGTMLLKQVTGEAVERGCSRLQLLNGKHRESYQRKYYEQQGWEERAGMANYVIRIKPQER